MADFTHFNDQGRARMVDVGEKDVTHREAVAAARVLVNRETFDLIRSGGVKKGDVLTVAQVAGIMNNDVITSFDGHTVRTYEDLNQLLPYYAGGTTVTLTVSRMEHGSYQEQTVEVTLGFRADHTS